MPRKKLKDSGKKLRQIHTLPKVLKTIEEYDELFKNSNIQAFLMTIRKGEGTLGPHDFYKHYGGGYLSTLDEQPVEGKIWSWGKKDHHPSSAVGAFMFLNSKGNPTWPDIAETYKLQNFSEINQIIGAEYSIDQDKALQYVLNGDIISAIRKIKGTWPSLPGGSQQEMTMQEALEFYQEQGGTLNDANLNYIPILNWKNRAVHPLDIDKQYPLIPEYLKMLMGKPNDPFINEKIPDGANKNKPSTTGMPDPVPGNITTGQPGVDRVAVTGPGSTWNNRLDRLYDLVNSSSNRYDNSYSYLPDVKKEPIGRIHPLVENAPIQLSYLNNGAGQNKFLNNPFPYFVPNDETSPIALPAKPNLIDTVIDRAKESDAIFKFGKRYDVPGIHENPIPKLALKKDTDIKHAASKKQAGHYASAPNTGMRTTTTINLNKPLIENFTINTKDIKEGMNDFKHKVEEVLLEILNSANVIQ